MKINFPDHLPVNARRLEIEDAFLNHQVIIVCGETGSGKTTQLPKIVMNLRQTHMQHQLQHITLRSAPNLKKLIGHTQPRRVAATSVAKRIAQELQTPLGEVVGYQIRFADKTSPTASIKLMTDGILLAQTLSDPLLSAYDTLIIDEAHERSLNIDFLLGYIRQLLPKRPDLKVIITSATIDAQKFSTYFSDNNHRPAPVISVQGRTFAVEQRYRPFVESKDYDLNSAICDAIDELWDTPSRMADVLIFLPGEREIREVEKYLKSHLHTSALTQKVLILPLFSRLSQAEQEQVFESNQGTSRIILATNVAETSLTIEGIRYVIDTGLARVKRYSYRNKVEQLLVEPISQASANQRAGRCGRVSNGVCIRLYDEKDFDLRPQFTDPEILRSSLALVILRMKALNLGDISKFNFLQMPSSKAISDGYQLLAELGAIDETNELTPIGHVLSQIPLDPRIARMLCEAKSQSALSEVLIIASALSVQDIRERPQNAQEQADKAHIKFHDPKSEFISYLHLWKWLEDTKGNSDHKTHKLSNRQYEQTLKQNFINVRRMREWRDVHQQLRTIVHEKGWKINTTPATYEQLHLSLLSGLLGNIGCKSPENEHYLGARNIKFLIHPNSNLRKKSGKWIVAAELVETTRLFSRINAQIESQWLEKTGQHLLKKQITQPHWEKKTAQVVGFERATLYGLTVYNARRVNYEKYDPLVTRQIFIQEALINGQWEYGLQNKTFDFLKFNQKLIAQVEHIEHKARRQDVLVDDSTIYAFYDQRIDISICSVVEFEKWYQKIKIQNPRLLYMTRDNLMQHNASSITQQAFPMFIKLAGVDCRVSYLHEISNPRDGVTVTIPIFLLNQIPQTSCEYLVPGMLKEKILALLKTLPQKVRSRLLPLSESATKITQQILDEPNDDKKQPLLETLTISVRKLSNLTEIKTIDFKYEFLDAHHFMNFCVVDENQRQLAMGRNLASLKSQLGDKARGAFQALAQLKLVNNTPKVETPFVTPFDTIGSATINLNDSNNTQDIIQPSPSKDTSENNTIDTSIRYVQWEFGALPDLLQITKDNRVFIGFPALIDQKDAVTIEVFDEQEFALRAHKKGVLRLLFLQLKDNLKFLEKNIPNITTMASQYMLLNGTQQELIASIIELSLKQTFLQAELPYTQNAFENILKQGKPRLILISNEISRLIGQILSEYAAAQRKLKDFKIIPNTPQPIKEAYHDIQNQIAHLIPKTFITQTPWDSLIHLPRYLKASYLRLEKLRNDSLRDASKLKEIHSLEKILNRINAQYAKRNDESLNTQTQKIFWLLQELRVSFFAQELKTPQPVSVKRIEKLIQQLQF